MPLTEADSEFPALSEMLTGPALRFAPSPVTKLSAGWVAGSMPESPSMPVHLTVTLSLYQPAPLAGVVGLPDRLGLVISMLMLSTVVEEFNAASKPIAFICHAGWVPISAGVIKGRRATSVEAIRDDMVNAGADWVDEPCVVDGNLISARTPADLGP